MQKWSNIYLWYSRVRLIAHYVSHSALRLFSRTFLQHMYIQGSHLPICGTTTISSGIVRLNVPSNELSSVIHVDQASRFHSGAIISSCCCWWDRSWSMGVWTRARHWTRRAKVEGSGLRAWTDTLTLNSRIFRMLIVRCKSLALAERPLLREQFESYWVDRSESKTNFAHWCTHREADIVTQ